MRSTAVLVRHGRTAWNAAGRYLGATDVDLDEIGQRQAAALAAALSDWTLAGIVSAPARRAVHTAEIIGAATDLPVEIDDRLREIDFGIAEGHTLDELRRTNPEAVSAFEVDADVNHFPQGERPASAAARARAAVEAAVATRGPGRTLVVGHNTLFRLMICAAIGIPMGAYRRAIPAIEHGTYSEISVHDAGWGLCCLNVPVSSGGDR